jgi:hypothetical protein
MGRASAKGGGLTSGPVHPGDGFANSMTREAYRALAANAVSRYNTKTIPAAPKVNPCQ